LFVLLLPYPVCYRRLKTATNRRWIRGPGPECRNVGGKASLAETGEGLDESKCIRPAFGKDSQAAVTPLGSKCIGPSFGRGTVHRVLSQDDSGVGATQV